MAIVSFAMSFVTYASHLSIRDFVIPNSFKVIIRPPKAPNIIEVIWHPPPRNWIKLNCDGASISPLGNSTCGGIARYNDGGFFGSFCFFFGSVKFSHCQTLGCYVSN